MEYLTLIGVFIIIIGFVLKQDVLAVVLVSAITTGLVAGIDIMDILAQLGSSFVSNRLMSIFLIMFPVIAIIERYGLKERAASLIGGIKNASAGIVLSIYSIIRTTAAAFNMRIGGHVQFVRPLILPMAEGAAKVNKGDDLTEDELEELKGHSAAIENFGNFFAQNCFPASAGVVLIQGTLAGLGYNVALVDIAYAAVPIAIISVLLAVIQVKLYDKRIKNGGQK